MHVILFERSSVRCDPQAYGLREKGIILCVDNSSMYVCVYKYTHMHHGLINLKETFFVPRYYSNYVFYLLWKSCLIIEKWKSV